jgi:tRNA threonylcarbamoyladenosine biosynthesis protein TsaB
VVILALDTSTRAGSSAVVRGTDVLSLVSGDPGRTHAERLPEELQRALTIAGVRLVDVSLLAVAAGPGAFTGLRIGLAAMQGLAMTLDKPVVGVSSLEALAQAARHDGSFESLPRRSSLQPRERRRVIGCWIDAQRGEVFAALYDGDDRLIDPPSVGTPERVLHRWRAAADLEGAEVIGDGAVRYAGALSAAGLQARPAPALAPIVARIAGERAAAGQAGPPHALAPLYVRRPDAEIDRDRRGGS